MHHVFPGPRDRSLYRFSPWISRSPKERFRGSVALLIRFVSGVAPYWA